MRHTFEGHNELSGMMNAVLWGIGTTFVLAGALTNASTSLAAVWVMGLLLTPVIWFGARYRLTISEEGVMLKNCTIWPVGRTRLYYLDCNAELYEAWDSDRPEGVHLHTGSLLDDSDVFGPYYDVAAMGRLAGEVNDAITDVRGRVAGPRPVNVASFEPGDFEVIEYAPGGAPRAVRNRRSLRVHGIEIPAQSRFDLHYADWVDPARFDTIRAIELAAPTYVHGHEVAAGGRLSFWADEVTVTGLPVAFDHDGIQVAGAAHPVTFRRNELTGFASAAPVRRGGFVLPPITEFRHETLLGEPIWRVTLGAPLEVAGVEAEAHDSITFDARWRPRYVSLQRESARVGGVKLQGTLQPLIVTKHGAIDLADCHKRGLIDPTSGYVSRAEQWLYNILFYGVGFTIYFGLHAGVAWLAHALG